MTELTIQSIAKKYELPEDTIEEIFHYYDTNDFNSLHGTMARAFFENPRTTRIDFFNLYLDLLRCIRHNTQPLTEEHRMKDTEEEIEIITLEEAIYDYKQGLEDYKKQRKNIDQYIQNDKDCLTAILCAHLGLKTEDIDIQENTITLMPDNQEIDSSMLRVIHDLDYKYKIAHDGIT